MAAEETQKLIESLRDARVAATPGWWAPMVCRSRQEGPHGIDNFVFGQGPMHSESTELDMACADMEFIALAANQLPALLDATEKLLADNMQLREALREVSKISRATSDSANDSATGVYPCADISTISADTSTKVNSDE